MAKPMLHRPHFLRTPDSARSSTCSAVKAPPRLVCVDLDGTLIKTDTLWESLLLLAKTRPWELVLTVVWLLRGKANLKRQLAHRVLPDPALLPYRPQVVNSLLELKGSGKTLTLATAADERVAQGVAHHLGFFDDVIASDGATNCAGTRKLLAIQRKAGQDGFAYWGDSRADLPLWRFADEAHIVNPSRRLAKAARAVCAPHCVFAPQRSRAGALVAALRPHQWVKNLLVVLPLFLAHEWSDVAKLAAGIAGLVAFSAAASAIYVLNDLLDIEADRRHPTKRRRPLAAGDVSVPAALLLAAGAALGAFAVAWRWLPPQFTAWLAAYLALTTAYSLYLKKQLLFDVILLAGLYTLRIAAGAAAVVVPLSPWLLAFAMFFFLSLALGKRSIELARVAGRPAGTLPGRGYLPGDLRLLQTIGPTSGLLAVLVFCLYLDSSAVGALYSHPRVLWLICPVLLYWIARFWLLVEREQVHDDPVVFAVKDRASLLSIAATTLLILAAGCTS